ncbi:MAG: alcohol dehydrogenase catalytic domain-containing protein [Caulobacterales bacterium]
MKRAIFNGVGKPLSIEAVERPRPAAHQALIKVERCGICGSDIHMTSGSPFDWPCGTALGHEYAGEVVEIAQDGLLKLGDRVTALPMSGCGECEACRNGTPLHCKSMQPMAGGYSEYTLIDQRTAMRLPDSVSFDDGALVEPLASSLRGVRRLTDIKNARVAVVGAGAIGAASIFWARRFGAGSIVCIAPSRRGEALAGQLGADGFATLGDDLAANVAGVLGGVPDIVIEGAGAPGAIQQAIDLVRVGGTVLSLGGCLKPDTIIPVLGMMKECDVRFSAAYSVQDFHTAIDAFAGGAVEPRAMIGETLSLEDLPARFDAMRTGSHPAKVMVRPHQAAG